MTTKLPVVGGSAEVIPPLYAKWMDAHLGGPIPAETEATCLECAMCAPPGAPRTGAKEYFEPDVKCCSFHPELPNFLVGRILLDDDPALADGRQRVEAKIAARVGVSPLGIARPASYDVLYKASSGAFGRSRTLVCPYFRNEGGGLCSIWRHREATCATFFCKHARGAIGSRFWRAAKALFREVEEGLARWCILELDPGGPALRALFPARSGNDRGEGRLDAAALDGAATPAEFAAKWGAWASRPGDFYRECARRVDALSWDDALAISGATARVRARLLRDAYAALTSGDMPAALRLGTFTLTPAGPGEYRVSSYSGFDPLVLPRALLDVLHRFDGRRPVPETLALISREDGVNIDPELILKLYEFDILVAA